MGGGGRKNIHVFPVTTRLHSLCSHTPRKQSNVGASCGPGPQEPDQRGQESYSLDMECLQPCDSPLGSKVCRLWQREEKKHEQVIAIRSEQRVCGKERGSYLILI